MQTTEAEQYPYGIMIETVECISHNGKHRKRGIKQTETKSLNFNLILIFVGSDLGSDNSNLDFD